MALEGELKDISLVGVMQILCMERRKAGLFVRRRGEEGAIYFDEGEIVHAMAGRMVGEEAVYQLLTWTDGSFRMNDQVMIPSRSIGKSWNFLLMEGMRRIDEQRKGHQPAAPAGRAVSPAEVERDCHLENDLIVLLSNLEQMMARLNEKKQHKRATLALSVLADMVNEVAAFCDGQSRHYPAVPLLRTVLGAAGETHPYVRTLPIQANRLAIPAGAFEGGSKGLINDSNPVVRQVSGGLALALEGYFRVFESCFRSPDMGGEWKETYGVFLADLRHMLDRFQF